MGISIDEIIKKLIKYESNNFSKSFGNSPNYQRLEALVKKKIYQRWPRALVQYTIKRNQENLVDVSVFSFHRTKTITTGEGGMTITDSKIYLNCKLLRDHGRGRKTRDLFNDEFALKYMPFNLQAALGYSQFKN